MYERECVYSMCNLNLSPSAHSSLSGHSKLHVLHRLRRMGLSNELFLVLISWTWEGYIHTQFTQTHTHIPINRNRPEPISPTHFKENDKISIVIYQWSSCLCLLFPSTETPSKVRKKHLDPACETPSQPGKTVVTGCLLSYLHMISWVNRTRHISGFLSWPS